VNVIALIGIADCFCNHHHKYLSTLNEVVFPFYIIHKSIIVVVGYILLSYNFSMLVDYGILIIMTFGLSSLYYFIGRSSNILRPLIGLKSLVKSREKIESTDSEKQMLQRKTGPFTG